MEIQADSHDGAGGIVARPSIARGRNMSPGIQQAQYYWRDVVHGPPPRRRERGTCLHVTWHGSDDSGDVRISFTTIVRVDSGVDKESVWDDIIHVEERTNVQRRLLQEMIDRERHFTDRVCLRMRSRLAQSMVDQRRRANDIETPWVATMVLGWIRFQAKAGTLTIKVFRGFMRALVAVPDAILTQTERASIHLASKSGRRWLKRAIRDPAAATPQEKAGVLVWLIVATTVWVLLAAVLFATFLSAYDDYFKGVFKDFLFAIGNAVGIPLPPAETFYIQSTIDYSAILGLTGAFVLAGLGLLIGKTLGSWMIYLMGDSLYDTLNKKSGPKIKKALAWLQRSAAKSGFAWVAMLCAVPALPDPLIIPFAVSGMKFRSYMIAVVFGTIVKFAILAGLILWIGPDRVAGFMAHPFKSMGL